jgi:hypothetical protein
MDVAHAADQETVSVRPDVAATMYNVKQSGHFGSSSAIAEMILTSQAERVIPLRLCFDIVGLQQFM